MKINHKIYLLTKQIDFYQNKSTDWFIRSYKFQRDSYEWQICRLKSKIYYQKVEEYIAELNDTVERNFYV